jgi:hypothetical protein
MSRVGKLLLLLVATVFIGCRNHESPGYEFQGDENSVYYWRTELRLDSTERAFLDRHDVKKVYCRYFDVVMRDGEPMPNATISFSDTLPSGVELVPTVYITEDCMHKPHPGLAGKLVSRVRQMNETNDLPPFRELQIDCDYTARSRQVYYDFLSEIAHSPLFTSHFSLLSTTIRLHQLQMKAPPVDYGVLMLYNTGDPRRFMERNPVLDLRDVQPYLRHLSDYPLPLAAAYPVYQWVRHIHGVRVEHTVEADEILRVKQAVEQERPELRRTILTYHLDKENINRYDNETYEKIYRH